MKTKLTKGLLALLLITASTSVFADDCTANQYYNPSTDACLSINGNSAPAGFDGYLAKITITSTNITMSDVDCYLLNDSFMTFSDKDSGNKMNVGDGPATVTMTVCAAKDLKCTGTPVKTTTYNFTIGKSNPAVDFNYTGQGGQPCKLSQNHMPALKMHLK